VVLAAVALAAGGTVLPFTLFASGQSRVSAEVAGAFYNIEPLVGAVAGIVLFGDPAGLAQAIGGAAIIAGIALSSLPLLGRGTRLGGAAAVVSPTRPGRYTEPGVTRSWPGCQTAARRTTAGPRARSRPPHRRGVAARRPGPPGQRWLPRVPAAGMPRRRVMAGRARGARGGRQAGRRRHSLASSP
jgi:hypothetical protein